MGDAGEERRTEAAFRRTRWPGWIWALPLAVLGIVVWLIIRHFAQEGPEITIVFPQAEGVKADDTKLIYRGMVVGQVTSVQLAKDLGHVIVTVRLRHDVLQALREGTRFWIAGAKPDFSDLSSLKSVVTGPHLAMDPGQGKPTRHFTGLDRQPQVLSGTPGVELTLHSSTEGALKAGAIIDYRGMEAGKIEHTDLAADGKGFKITAFVHAPFDRLVTSRTQFWKEDAVQISAGGHGVTANLAPLPAVLFGGVAFDTPGSAQGEPPVKWGAQFPLYHDKAAADAAPIGPQVAFLVRFDGAVGDLSPGAPVTLKGFRVGRVTGVSLAYDVRSSALQTPVTIEVEPDRLHVVDGSPPPDGNWSPLVTEAMDRLVREGLRARLERSTPLIGGKTVVLDFPQDAGPAALNRAGAEPEIPTAPSGEIQEIARQVHAVMAKVEAMPIAEIGQEVRRTARHVDGLVSSPQVRRSLSRVDEALASADAVLGGSGAEQDRNIPRAIEELSGAARSIRELADYLDRHPEALIAGRTAEGGTAGGR